MEILRQKLNEVKQEIDRPNRSKTLKQLLKEEKDRYTNHCRLHSQQQATIKRLSTQLDEIKRKIIRKAELRNQEPNFQIEPIIRIEECLKLIRQPIYDIIDHSEKIASAYQSKSDLIALKTELLQQIQEERWAPKYEAYAKKYKLIVDPINLFSVCNQHFITTKELDLMYDDVDQHEIGLIARKF